MLISFAKICVPIAVLGLGLPAMATESRPVGRCLSKDESIQVGLRSVHGTEGLSQITLSVKEHSGNWESYLVSHVHPPIPNEELAESLVRIKGALKRDETLATTDRLLVATHTREDGSYAYLELGVSDGRPDRLILPHAFVEMTCEEQVPSR